MKRKLLKKFPWLRPATLRVLSWLSPGTITIRHHHVDQKLRLDTFKHRGYWFHGKWRELSSVRLMQRLIEPGWTVWEVGGHIGYFSQLFADLAGPTGRVTVFEPGSNNLPFLRRNVETLTNLTVVEKAVNDHSGEVAFYLEDLTGQNNSLRPEYQNFQKNLDGVRGSKGGYQKTIVAGISLDDYQREVQTYPDFVKIDIEGAELSALRGMDRLLREQPPIMMVEITEAIAETVALILSYGYELYHPSGHALAAADVRGNTFCLHPDHHAAAIQNVPYRG